VGRLCVGAKKGARAVNGAGVRGVGGWGFGGFGIVASGVGIVLMCPSEFVLLGSPI
jgi:hypothetical protein